MHATIEELEERLRKAQLASDVRELDELIDEGLQFVFFDGGVYTKKMDLDAHRAGVFKIRRLEFSERRITLHGDVAIVTVRAAISGEAGGSSVEDDLRYLRTWALRDGRWRVIAGSVSRLSPTHPKPA